jgi:hypothetical protein
MTPSRIKDPRLSARIEPSEMAWLGHITPITEHYCREVRRRDYRGKKLACWMHVRFNNMPMLLALADSGAEGAAPGLQPYPAHAEQEIARLSVKLTGRVS